jgi:hypothetical protein
LWRETRCGLASPAFDLKATTSLYSARDGWDSNLGTGYKKQLVRLYSIRCKTFRTLTSAASSNCLTNQRRPRSTAPDCHDYRLCDYLFCCPSVQNLTRAFLILLGFKDYPSESLYFIPLLLPRLAPPKQQRRTAAHHLHALQVRAYIPPTPSASDAYQAAPPSLPDLHSALQPHASASSLHRPRGSIAAA